MKKGFSETLKQLRIDAGYTQKQVYEMIGVPQSTFSSWEVGKSEPSADVLLKLCKIYGVNDILSAFGYDGYNEDGSICLNMREIDIVEKYRTLDDDGRKHIDYELNREASRVKQLQDLHSQLENRPAALIDFPIHPDTPERYIQYFYSVSAGTGQVIFDDAYSDRIVIPDIPKYRRVAYAVKVTGHSMEPLYFDGDNLLVEPTCEIQVGEIGIFNVDGQAYVKKLGDGELISLNKGYDNIPLTEGARCMGRVVDRFSIETD